MAGVLAPVATQVGLQLILQPYSNTIGKIACTAVGILYPSYASFRALEILRLHNDSNEAGRWLNYWAIYGLLTAIERSLDRIIAWVPYYSTLKLAILLWLQIPRYSGAYRLTVKFMRPLLRELHPHIDALLRSLKETVSRPEITALASAFNEAMAHIPILEWFVRTPDGRRYTPPPRGRGSDTSFITSR